MRQAEELPYTVEIWDADGSSLIQTLARCSSATLAIAAFEAAIEVQPRERITARHGARVLRESSQEPQTA